jgi:AcrR family transcriptional regulator
MVKPSTQPGDLRADAARNRDKVLAVARRQLADGDDSLAMNTLAKLAGVGVGTIYRHFPQRSDLIKAVFQREVDACAAAAPALTAEFEPGEALSRWLHRYTEFLATKRGLAAALHSGDPAFNALPAYFMQGLGPVLDSLLAAAAAAGEIRGDIGAEYLLHAVANLCNSPGGVDAAYSQRMVSLLLDGMRFGAVSAKEDATGEAKG